LTVFLFALVGGGVVDNLKFDYNSRITLSELLVMIRLGNHIRLTPREIARLEMITGFSPAGVKTMADFDAYVRNCKEYYWGVSRDTQFLHHLIDVEKSACLSGRK
jgi:hypothetical protein